MQGRCLGLGRRNRESGLVKGMVTIYADREGKVRGADIPRVGMVRS